MILSGMGWVTACVAIAIRLAARRWGFVLLVMMIALVVVMTMVVVIVSVVRVRMGRFRTG